MESIGMIFFGVMVLAAVIAVLIHERKESRKSR